MSKPRTPGATRTLLLAHTLTFIVAAPLHSEKKLHGRDQGAEHEWFPRSGKLKKWRQHAAMHIEKECERREGVPGSRCSDLDVYEFGVFTGRALKVLMPWLLNAPKHDNKVKRRIVRHVYGEAVARDGRLKPAMQPTGRKRGRRIVMGPSPAWH